MQGEFIVRWRFNRAMAGLSESVGSTATGMKRPPVLQLDATAWRCDCAGTRLGYGGPDGSKKPDCRVVQSVTMLCWLATPRRASPHRA